MFDAQQNISAVLQWNKLVMTRLSDAKSLSLTLLRSKYNSKYKPQPPARPDPKAEAWAEKNNWFGTDQTMTYAAFGIHRQLIEDEGFDPASDEYYTELDSRVRKEFPHKFKEATRGDAGPRVASAESSASKAPSQKGRRTVKLTPSQIAIAKRLNVPLEEYAKYVKD